VKKYTDLSDEQRQEVLKCIGELVVHGAACIIAAAKNANENYVGWPPVSDHEVSLCDIFDVLYEARCQIVAQRISIPYLLFGPKVLTKDIYKSAIHAAMHDAFALGIATMIDNEMDFQGVTEILNQLDTDTSEGWEGLDV